MKCISIYLSTVGITLFSIQTAIFLDVLKSIIHYPTFTTIVTVLAGAVHQLLLTEGYKLSRLDRMLALH